MGMVVIMIVVAASAFAMFMDGGGSTFEILLCAGNFFFRCRSHFADFDLKSYGLSRKRMIRVHHECVRKHLDDAHRHRVATRILCDEFIPEGNILASLKVSFVDLEDAVLVMFTKCIVRLHRKFSALSGAHAYDAALEPRNDLRISVDVLQWFCGGCAIRRISVLIKKDVRENHMGVGTDREGGHEARPSAMPPPRLQASGRVLFEERAI